MKTIRLHGELGRKFGEYHRLAVNSTAEAVRALSANFKGFQNYILQYQPGFHVIVDKSGIDERQLQNPASAEIEFIPVVAGSGPGGRGGLAIIIGAVLVVAGAIMVYTGFGASVGAYLIKVGAAMILGGVVQALTPVPKAPEPPERPDNKPSYVFNGPVNTTAQGQPVPIGYGRLIVGGAVISAGITVDSLVPITDLPTGSVVYQG